MILIKIIKRKWEVKLKKWSKVLILVLAIFCTLKTTYAYYSTSSKNVNTFKSEKYSIKLNANGGVYKNYDVSVLNGKTTLPTPTKTGYSFAGYSNSSTGNVQYSTNINDIEIINNKEIYAMWNVINYNISYNLNGGSISGQKSTYNIEESFTLPNPTRTGYTFAGWTGSNGTTPQTNVTIPKGTYGNLTYNANWYINTYSVDVNSIIQNTTYNSGLAGFTFSVWLDGKLEAENVTDYYNSAVPYGSKIRVYVNDRDGYNVKSFRDNTWTITGNLEINPNWYDDIPPTITSFSVTNLGYFDASAGDKKGWNIRVYVNAYDNGTGIQKYQTWLAPYGNGSGSGRKDGQDRILENVLYLNTSSGRTFCAYAIDWAGNESSKCETIWVN
jgi:uncharacterized repeat protein (TIGR02543 family)